MSSTAVGAGLLAGTWPVWLIAGCAGLSVILLLYLMVQATSALLPRYRARFVQSVDRQLRRLNVYIDATRLLTANLLAAVVVSLIVWWLVGSVLLTAAAAMAVGLLPRVILWWIRRGRLRALCLQLPDMTMLLAGGLRAGLSLNQAMAQTAGEIAPPLRQELELMLREQRIGASFDSALAGFERRIPVEESILLCAALRISRQTGGDLAQTLEALADALRRKIALEGKILALTAQGRMQGWAMGLLPALCAGALALIEPQAMSLLLSTPIGWATCAGLLVMQALGLHFVRRIVRIDV